MRLLVKHGDRLVNELRFEQGPVYIGRQMGSEVFLPDVAVSRKHAVINKVQDKNWRIEDLGSSNKTLLNGDFVGNNALTDGDVLQIGEFIIEVHLETDRPVQTSAKAGETHTEVFEIETIVRKFKGIEAGLIRFPPSRAEDFAYASRAICKSADLEQLYQNLLEVISKQFSSLDTWVCLRTTPDGKMEYQGGRRKTGQGVKLAELIGQRDITNALEKCQYILLPQLPREILRQGIRSIIICPILRDGKSYGLLYANNSKKQEHYSLEDLDYLMFIAILTAAVMEKL